MDTYLFLYPETSFFEVVLTAYFMNTKGNVRVISEEQKGIKTNEGITISPDVLLHQVSASDMDVLIICGGNTNNIKCMEQLHHLIRECHAKDKIIGGICAGSQIVKDALQITDCPDTTQTIGKIILSPGNEYVDFALAVGKTADIYEDEADYMETVNYFKFFLPPES